jgi:multisubunit Na+/H+ antiporter MnhG subunit
MEIFTWYLIASYLLTLTLSIVIAVNDYRLGNMNYSLSDITVILFVLAFSPITLWIMVKEIIKENLPEDFWTRPIIKIKKK